MKIFFVLFALMVAVKTAVAITEHPHALFEALHESGEAREGAQRNRDQVSFFAEAVARVRRAAFVWMAQMVAGDRNGTAHRYFSMESGTGRSVSQGNGSAPKWTIHSLLSLRR